MSGKIWWLALLCGAAIALPATAQEGAGKDEAPAQAEAPAAVEEKEAPPPPPAAAKSAQATEEPMNRWGAMTLSLAAWSPSMVGGEEEIAIKYPTSGSAYPVLLGADASLRESWMVAYHLPKYLGSIVLHYDSMNYDDDVSYATPGVFRFGESRAYPGFRGAFDDGLADAVEASASRKAREFRFEFSNTAWETKHTYATWGAGLHNVDYSEQLQIRYLALVPNLPPVIPPVVPPSYDPATLAPRPDYVSQQSDYSGSGVGASLDVEFRLAPRFSIISGLSIGLLRGEVSTEYESQTSYYFTSEFGGLYLDKDDLFFLLNNGSPTNIQAISQQSVIDTLTVDNVSQAAQTFDVYVGIQARVWRGLKLFATWREMYYQNVGATAVPEPGMTIARETFSVGYEGYMFGASWRF